MPAAGARRDTPDDTPVVRREPRGCAPIPHEVPATADVARVTVQDAAAPTSARRAGGGPTRTPELYDFRRPMTLAREHGRALEMAFETYARQASTLLTSRLRVVAQATLVSVQLHSYDEYVRSLPTPTAMILCTLEQARATAVVQLPTDTTMLWVDYLLGGPGIVLADAERELTDIEWRLVRDLVQVSLGDLAYAFTSIVPLDTSVRSVQYSPQFVQAAAASDPVLVATLELVAGDHTSTATLMFPADVLLAPLRDGDATVRRSLDEVREHEEAVGRLAAQVNEVPVGVSVRLAPVTVTPARLADLAVGDLLPLDHRVGNPMDVVVDDVVMARAALGSNGSRLACLVVTSEESTR